jgi:hypothetical protein
MRWKRGNRLRLVSEREAPPVTRVIFDEVRHSLGLPIVPTLYQAYAAFPGFLSAHWEAFRPVLQSRQFFILGARLAAESYTRAHSYFDIPSLTMCDVRSEVSAKLPIAQVLDYYQYLDPLLLLISSAQMQALEGTVGQEGSPEPANHPEFPVAPCFLHEEQATAALHRIWDERRRVLEVAFVSDEHRALACWPDLYCDYWRSLKSLLQSPLYADCQYRIGQSAWDMARELPVRVETGVTQLLEAGMESEELSSLARINEAFMQAMTGLVLDVTVARIGCDGGCGRQQPASKEAVSTQNPKKRKSRSRTRAA